MKQIPVELYAVLHDMSGYAVHARAVARFLIAHNFKVKLVSYNFNHDLPFDDLIPYQHTVLKRNYPIIRIVILPPHPVYQKNRYTILYTMMETKTLHPGVISRLRTADEIWSPNIYNVAQFRAALKKTIPVHYMPEGTDPELYKPQGDKLNIRQNADFLAISVFSWQWRKGPDILIDAWLKAFTSKDNARLILRTNVPTVSKKESRQIIEAEIQRSMYRINNTDPAPIEICDDFIPTKDMPAFYRAADCFILPTRGEGWCLPAIDSMACGTPIIITNCTGQLSYCNKKNSILIPAGKPTNFVPEKVRLMNFYDDQKFYNPSATDCASALKKLYADPVYSKTLGEAASKEIRDTWPWNRALSPIAERLMRIYDDIHPEN